MDIENYQFKKNDKVGKLKKRQSMGNQEKNQKYVKKMDIWKEKQKTSAGAGGAGAGYRHRHLGCRLSLTGTGTGTFGKGAGIGTLGAS